MATLTSFILRLPHFVALSSLLFKQTLNLNPNSQFPLPFQSLRFFSGNSWLSDPGKPLNKWPIRPADFGDHQPNLSSSGPNPSRDPKNDFAAISKLFMNHGILGGESLHAALDRAGIEPTASLLVSVFEHFDSSPRLLHSLFLWAESKPGFRTSVKLFDLMIGALANGRDFASAWSLILDRIGKEDEVNLVTERSFVFMIRHYARAGMVDSAIRTYEFAKSSSIICKTSSEIDMFQILLDALCKAERVKEASQYVARRRGLEPSWVPTIQIYNILLNGWLRSWKISKAEELWMDMKKNNVQPTVVTYGTLVEGYCHIRRIDTAMELLSEMRLAGIEPNAIVYNPIIDALAEAKRFKEASSLMERFSILKSGPTISTYNSLVKGYCKAEDLPGASKILKTMIGRGVIPTATTYNHFFSHFAKFDKIDEGMNLYTKMIESGYSPDPLTYQLLLKMLCHSGKLELALQVSREMRSRGCDSNLACSTIIVHCYCNMSRLEEACAEFEDMVRRGLIPRRFTIMKLTAMLEKRGMFKMAAKLEKLYLSVPRSTKLPYTQSRDTNKSHSRRYSVTDKDAAVLDDLKHHKDPILVVKHKASHKTLAKQLRMDIESGERYSAF